MLNFEFVSCFSSTKTKCMWGALCTLHLYLVSESCIWAAICTLYHVSRIRIPYLGLILYPVSRISYPYQVFGAIRILCYVSCFVFLSSCFLALLCIWHPVSCISNHAVWAAFRIPYPVSVSRIAGTSMSSLVDELRHA